MPVIPTMPEEIEIWMTAPAEEALKLQRPLPDGELEIVARGKQRMKHQFWYGALGPSGRKDRVPLKPRASPPVENSPACLLPRQACWLSDRGDERSSPPDGLSFFLEPQLLLTTETDHRREPSPRGAAQAAMAPARWRPGDCCLR
jgi:hypothetical protein